MTGWTGFTVLEPVCHFCGARLPEWTGPLGFGDARDTREEQHARNALALQTHRLAEHPVQPAVDDLVQYAMPWRGHVLISETYRVTSIRTGIDHHDFARSMSADVEPLIGTSYTLTNPRRADDRCFPFAGDPHHPLTFEIVTAAPPVQTDLLDLLEWDPA